MTGEARLQALVTGDVQGVGFRDWIRTQARRFDVSGSAVNRPDGGVEVVAEGTRESCESLLAALRGSTPGSVVAVDESWSDAGGENGFRIG